MSSLRGLLLASSALSWAQLAGAQPALAEHREVRLSWVRSATAASCPDAGHVEADVERRLGWSPFVRGAGTAESIEAVVSHDSEVWRAAIELRAADGSSLGSRNVESPAASCASLAAAAGLAVALMIEPLLPPDAPAAAVPAAPTRSKPSASTPAPNPDATTDPDAEGEASGPGAHRRSPSSVSDGSLSLGGVGVSGVLPSFAWGVTLAGSVRVVEHLYVSASATLLPEQHARSAARSSAASASENSAPGADIGFGMTLGAIGPCYRVPLASRLSVASCASLLLGSMQVIVDSPEPVAAGARPWWGASTGLRLGWHPGRFGVSLGVDALAHFKRRSYRVEQTQMLDSAPFFVEPAAAIAGSLLFGAGF